MTIDELIAKLEAASGPDRRIDAMIWQLQPCDPPDCNREIRDRIVNRFLAGQQWDDPEVPAYTASLDAALSLVPEGWEWAWYHDSGEYRAEIGDPLLGIEGKAATMPLALCIAALRARRSQGG